jgi:adenosylcobyric acid synthase
LDPEDMLDLSVSMNPFAPDVTTLALSRLHALRRYPDARDATVSLAHALGVEPSVLVLTNGGAEAIRLAGGWIGRGKVLPFEFSLLGESLEHLCEQGSDVPLVRSNPNNPTGELASPEETAALWDEAFYQMTTGTWTRRDFEQGSVVVGSLTKLFYCPGLRLGYVIAPCEDVAVALRARQPAWAVNGLALGLCPVLLEMADLVLWAHQISDLKDEIARLLRCAGFEVVIPAAPWVLATHSVMSALLVRKELAQRGVLVRSCASFGLPNLIRVGLLHPRDLPRLISALDSLELPAKRAGDTAPSKDTTPSKDKAPSKSVGKQEPHEPAPFGGKSWGGKPGARRANQQGSFGRGIMIAGTGSDVGKSVVVTGLCRALFRRGIKVVPFKSQNMSLNAAVVGEGEMARAQVLQAQAAGLEPSLAMNPILLKPTSEQSSQLVVMGKVLWEGSARDYQRDKPSLWPVVLGALEELAEGADLLVCEGAGGAAEINLLDGDLGNLPLARRVGYPAWIVGDIDKGGVFASLAGTYWMLPSDLRRTVRGFLINKMRGDRSLLATAIEALHAATGVPTRGVLPYVMRAEVDPEDSMWLHAHGAHEPDHAGRRGFQQAEGLDVAVVCYPRIANFTDLDPLRVEPGVRLRFVRSLVELGHPDLVILPGSKATVSDLGWLHSTGIAEALQRWAARPDGPAILGICAGYQMLGHVIEDDVESRRGVVPALGLLPVRTVFQPEKLLRRRFGMAMLDGACQLSIRGYEMRYGRPRLVQDDRGAGDVRQWSPSSELSGGRAVVRPWIFLDDGYGTEQEGALQEAPLLVAGTSMHGIFENDELRSAFLSRVAALRSKTFAPSGVSFDARREEWIDALAEMVETHVDLSCMLEEVGLFADCKGRKGGRL